MKVSIEIAKMSGVNVVECPDAFKTKMRRMKESPPLDGADMFVPAIKAFEKYPCSLVFEETVREPMSEAAVDIMDRLSDALGPLGHQEGFYGAGGGPMHLFYFGKYNDGESFPKLSELLRNVMMLNEALLPPFPWVSSVDATHQKLFPRTAAEMGDKYTFLKTVYEIIDCPSVSRAPYAFPDACRQQFAFMDEPRLLFVEPHFRMLHDGGCPEGCPRDESVLAEVVGGDPWNPGDLFESPSFAFIYLKSGEILVLCNWDYRD